MHPALVKGAVAVVTGAASGIGLAAARHLAGLGLRVCLADRDGEALERARQALVAEGASAAEVVAVATDVSERRALTALADRVEAAFGAVNVLMNNAGIGPGSSIFDAEGALGPHTQRQHGRGHSRLPDFCAAHDRFRRARPDRQHRLQQGITTPPGDPAYNLSKAGVKVFTEALQHALRNMPGVRVEARLFIPGFVYTPLTAHGRAQKPAGAWTRGRRRSTFLFRSIERGDFYILCPDNETDRRTDEKRILWAAGDIVENRPPLSRWHPDYAEAFQEWLKR